MGWVTLAAIKGDNHVPAMALATTVHIMFGLWMVTGQVLLICLSLTVLGFLPALLLDTDAFRRPEMWQVDDVVRVAQIAFEPKVVLTRILPLVLISGAAVRMRKIR